MILIFPFILDLIVTLIWRSLKGKSGFEKMQERVVKIILPIKQKESGLELLDSEADVKTKTKMSKIYMVFVLLSTAVLLKVLETRLADLKSTWKKVLKKSKTWLDDIVKSKKPLIEGQELHGWVDDFLAYPR